MQPADNVPRDIFNPPVSRDAVPPKKRERPKVIPAEQMRDTAVRTGGNSPVKLTPDHLKKLRYAQATMRDTTGDGLPIERLVSDMKERGYDKRHPINVVNMPRGPHDSPLKPGETGKHVAYDTRRTNAARKAASELDDFFAYVQIKEHGELALKEYEALKHLTFENRKIPQHVRRVWILEWERMHDERLLREMGIQPKTWGHLIKLRMAMSTDESRSRKAETNAGFTESPSIRPTRRPRQPKDGHPAPDAKKKLF